jgi:hypothetical protein
MVTDASPFTERGWWSPHVTIAASDLTVDLAGAVMAWLAKEQPSPWEGLVDRLALIESDEQTAHVQATRRLRR